MGELREHKEITSSNQHGGNKAAAVPPCFLLPHLHALKHIFVRTHQCVMAQGTQLY